MMNGSNASNNFHYGGVLGHRGMYQSEAASQMLMNDNLHFHGLYRIPNSEFNGKIERKPHDDDTKDTNSKGKGGSGKNEKVRLNKKTDENNKTDDGGCC